MLCYLSFLSSFLVTAIADDAIPLDRQLSLQCIRAENPVDRTYKDCTCDYNALTMTCVNAVVYHFGDGGTNVPRLVRAAAVYTSGGTTLVDYCNGECTASVNGNECASCGSSDNCQVDLDCTNVDDSLPPFCFPRRDAVNVLASTPGIPVYLEVNLNQDFGSCPTFEIEWDDAAKTRTQQIQDNPLRVVILVVLVLVGTIGFYCVQKHRKGWGREDDDEDAPVVSSTGPIVYQR